MMNYFDKYILVSVGDETYNGWANDMPDLIAAYHGARIAAPFGNPNLIEKYGLVVDCFQLDLFDQFLVYLNKGILHKHDWNNPPAGLRYDLPVNLTISPPHLHKQKH